MNVRSYKFAIVGCLLLLAAGASFADAAVDAAAAESKKRAAEEAGRKAAQELRQLVNRNNQEINGICWRLAEGQFNKDPIAFESNATHAVELMQLPVEKGRPDSKTLTEVYLSIIRGRTNPMQPRYFDQIKKWLDLAGQAADKPVLKANVAFARAKFDYFAALDDDTEKPRKALLDVLNIADLTPENKLGFVAEIAALGLIENYSYEKEGWKIAGPVPELRAKYYGQLWNVLQKGGSMLDPMYSNEHRLEVCDKALADEAVKNKDTFLDYKLHTLSKMFRHDEVEQLLLDRAATTNMQSRAHWSGRLGNHYMERSHRYYSARDPVCLDKAAAAYNVVLAIQPNDTRCLERLVEIAMIRKDYEAAESSVKRYIATHRNSETNLYAARVLGQIAYARGNYPDAIKCYGLYSKSLGGEDLLKYARSFHAADDLKSTLEQIEELKKRDGHMKGDIWENASRLVKKELDAKK